MENIVILSVENYDILCERVRITENKLRKLSEVILKNTKLTEDKEELELDWYDIKHSQALSLVQEFFPGESENRFKRLKEKAIKEGENV